MSWVDRPRLSGDALGVEPHRFPQPADVVPFLRSPVQIPTGVTEPGVGAQLTRLLMREPKAEPALRDEIIKNCLWFPCCVAFF
jgi:hypothetical protein